MIKLSILLDVCGISYTEKQLLKLEKLVNDLLKQYIKNDFKEVNPEENLPEIKTELEDEERLSVENELLEDIKVDENIVNEDVTIQQNLNLNLISKETKREQDPFVGIYDPNNQENLEIKDGLIYDSFEKVGTNENSFNDYLEGEKIDQGSDTINRFVKSDTAAQSEPTCLECGLLFESIVLLNLHQDMTHKCLLSFEERSKKKWQCPLCKNSFDDGKIFLHVKSCEILQANKQAKKLEKHLPKSYPCDKCHLKFRTSLRKKLHVKEIHDKVFDHICSKCGDKFASNFKLDRHDLKVHKQKKSVECQDCKKKFPTPSHLQMHIKIF
mgnify:FL=1